MKYEEFIDLFNSLTSRKFRYLDKKARRQFVYLNKNGITKEDCVHVIKSAYKDGWHIQTHFKYLTPEFLTRDSIFERYLNSIQDREQKTEEQTVTDFDQFIEGLKSKKLNY